jgi:tRNA threonylcarbamoyladenosine biosynthesis protein TsaE
MELVKYTYSAQQTKQMAAQLGQRIEQGILITLQGDLGTGKTTFAQGLALGLGVEKTVNSPTFTISKIYHGRLNLIHIDAYRLEGLHQDLGFDEFFDPQWVCVVEWPDYIKDILPKIRIDVRITRIDEFSRQFHFTCDDALAHLLEGIA